MPYMELVKYLGSLAERHLFPASGEIIADVIFIAPFIGLSLWFFRRIGRRVCRFIPQGLVVECRNQKQEWPWREIRVVNVARGEKSSGQPPNARLNLHGREVLTTRELSNAFCDRQARMLRRLCRSAAFVDQRSGVVVAKTPEAMQACMDLLARMKQKTRRALLVTSALLAGAAICGIAACHFIVPPLDHGWFSVLLLALAIEAGMLGIAGIGCLIQTFRFWCEYGSVRKMMGKSNILPAA
jgi:hypothetical protein